MHWKKDRKRNCRLWSSFIWRESNQFEPIVGKVTAYNDHWEGTFLTGMRDTLQVLKNQDFLSITLCAKDETFLHKLKHPLQNHKRRGTIARDIIDLMQAFRSITYRVNNETIKALTNYLEGALVGTYYYTSLM
ncbi:uncharacterized protein G2W53_037086 [Senna tora]|uniref:Uncharacterized protein n=1 Tax=Senna tora TaxID=362788 RepID=A0A834SVM3_9FABA|nr:uncharacterized protein G2W53_037086 [Senna tora]